MVSADNDGVVVGALTPTVGAATGPDGSFTTAAPTNAALAPSSAVTDDVSTALLLADGLPAVLFADAATAG